MMYMHLLDTVKEIIQEYPDYDVDYRSYLGIIWVYDFS